MTGAYLRVKRDNKWENIEVEYLTDEERKNLFTYRTTEEIVNWLNLVCNTLNSIEISPKKGEKSREIDYHISPRQTKINFDDLE